MITTVNQVAWEILKFQLARMYWIRYVDVMEGRMKTLATHRPRESSAGRKANAIELLVLTGSDYQIFLSQVDIPNTL